MGGMANVWRACEDRASRRKEKDERWGLHVEK